MEEQRTFNPLVQGSSPWGGTASHQLDGHIATAAGVELQSLPRICRERLGAMGTMRQRSPGKWELVVSAGINPATGRYHRVVRTVATKSKREAKAALATLEAAVAAGIVSFDDPTLASLLDRWMDHITSLGRADRTLYHYRQYIDREIVPVLGAIKLSRLRALDIDRLYGNLRKRGLAPATIRQVHAILRASLNQADRWGLVQRNVAKLASAPSQPQREQHPPTVDEVRALIRAAAELDPQFGLYIRVMVATGARRAEVCGLRWSDVDFEAGTLNVARSYTLVPGVRGDRPTKTRSTRLVILDPITLDGLRSGLADCVALAERFGIVADVRRAGYMFTDDPTGRNDRELTTADGDAVRNRELWTVTQVHADGSLTVRRTNRHAVAVLPAEYVSEHVRLGYAATEHGNGTDTQVRAHAAGNQRAGNTLDTQIAAMIHCLPYIGFPRTLNAIHAILETTTTRQPLDK
jgi:integrase